MPFYISEHPQSSAHIFLVQQKTMRASFLTDDNRKVEFPFLFPISLKPNFLKPYLLQKLISDAKTYILQVTSSLRCMVNKTDVAPLKWTNFTVA